MYGKLGARNATIRGLSEELSAIQSAQQTGSPPPNDAAGSFLSDWEWHIADDDREKDTFLLFARAVPKAARSGATAHFELTCGEVFSTSGVPAEGGIEAQLTVSVAGS